LQDSEQLLEKNNIVIEANLSNAAKNTLKYDLASQYRLVPNDKAFGFFKPRLWFYYRQQEKKDSTAFDAFIQNKIAEPPSLFDSLLIYEGKIGMERLLYNRGYLQPKVNYTSKVKKQKVKVTYEVVPGKLFTIRSFSLICPDDTIRGLLNDVQHESNLQVGKPLSNALLDSEKQRITKYLQNQGYANFSYANFSKLEVTDTTDGRAKTRLRILPLQTGKLERKYVGKVIVNNQFKNDFIPDDLPMILDNIEFHDFNVRNRIRPDALLKYIHLRPGALFQRDAFLNTRNQLQLPAIRFAEINAVERTDQSNIIDYRINLLPAKRIETEYEYEINQTRVGSESFVGLGASVGLINNNFLGGSEKFSNGLDASLEIDIDGGGFFNAVNLNFNNALEFPRFADYLGMYKFLRKINLLSQEKYDRIREVGNSILNLTYEYVDLFQWYNYHSINTEFGFRAIRSTLGERKSLQISHPSLTYFDPTTESNFDSLYTDQTFAQKSFAPQLFTSFFFNKIQYSKEKFQGTRGYSSAFLANFEVSGIEVFLANQIANGLRKPFKLGKLTFAQFLRLDLDGRLYKQISSDQVLAFRANVGMAVPFGTSDVIPYVKQFYLGGPISVRAWKIRELGPGAYVDSTLSRVDNDPFFQAGDIKLLVNAEYRFGIFWRIEGALFLDAGNIWTLKKDERTGGHFSSQFLKQMAVGSGLGLRFDATYFKVVLDLGVKLRNPYPDELGRYGAIQKGIPSNEVLNLNFAINYPF
jgi:outer membrane protein assembly factor BamA